MNITNILLIILILSCSSGQNKNYYNQQNNYTSYSTEINSKIILTKEKSISNPPLNVSTNSYLQIQSDIEKSTIPTNIQTEELINYFQYNYPKDKEKSALGIYTEVAICPWNTKNKLVHIGIYSNKVKKKEEKKQNLDSKNVIFAVDTSGSMSSDFLTAKDSMKIFLKEIGDSGKLGIIQYESDAKIVLQPTNLENRRKIFNAIDGLKTDGGTNAWTGISLAYNFAKQFKNQTKIVILTDGDFGGVNENEFVNLINQGSRAGITLTILGFGIKENSTMDFLKTKKKADTFYIDSAKTGKGKFQSQSWVSSESLAKDLNLEVKFNPNEIESYRVIGFEKSQIGKKEIYDDVDFDYSYTVLYEVTPIINLPSSGIISEVKLNYKTSNGIKEERKTSILNSEITAWETSENFRFSAGVAGFGMILNNSIHKGTLDYYLVIHLVQTALSFDPDGLRLEFLRILNTLKNY